MRLYHGPRFILSLQGLKSLHSGGCDGKSANQASLPEQRRLLKTEGYEASPQMKASSCISWKEECLEREATHKINLPAYAVSAAEEHMEGEREHLKGRGLQDVANPGCQWSLNGGENSTSAFMLHRQQGRMWEEWWNKWHKTLKPRVLRSVQFD